MFTFKVGIPKIGVDEDNYTVYLFIDGYGETLSGATRSIFVESGINEILKIHGLWEIGNGDPIIKYIAIKHCLDKIRKTQRIHGTETLWIDEAITKAIEKYGEDKLYCYFG